MLLTIHDQQISGIVIIIIFIFKESEFIALIDTCLSFLFAKHCVFGCCECLTNSHMFAENAVVESSAELRHSSVTNLLSTTHTYHMFGSCS